MIIPYNEAMSAMRSWQTLEPSPTLIVDFSVSGLANVHSRCDGMKLSDDTLTLVFGRASDGEGQITIPLKSSLFNLVTPSDQPSHLRTYRDDNILCWLE